VTRARVRSTSVRLWFWLTLVAAGLLATPWPNWAVEAFYARPVFPLIQGVVTFVTNLFPFAVLDVMIAMTVLLVIYRLVRLTRVALTDDVVDAIWEGVKRVLRFSAAVVIVFVVFWGFNYRREPLELVVGQAPPPTVQVLESTIADANALATSVRPRATARGEENLTYEILAERLRRPMATALLRLRRPGLAVPGRPKYSLIVTPFFRWASVTGMINPLALETVVDPDLLPTERPYVLAHEWAHLAGLADEAEASAVGWLACMNGGPALAYSANLYLIAEAAGGLPPNARRAALAKLNDGVKADLNAIADRALQVQKPSVERAASKVYDGYLRANRVEDGAASYARAVRLILSPELRAALSDYRGDVAR
jgi:hypothetical protein